MRTHLIAAIMVVVALFAAHPASAAGKPAARCPATFDTAQAEAGEIQAAYVLSEARNRKSEACVRAKLYIRALQRVADAAKAAPKGCPPVNPAVVAQYYAREQTIWRGKVDRVCTASTGASQQHRIIHVEPAE